MPAATWNSQLETGIDLIDAQHKALFEAINQFAVAVEGGRTEQGIAESLDFLATYTLDHFEAEERFMENMGFPGLAPHRAEHQRLLIRVRVLQGRLAQHIPVAREVAALLAGWLKHHISEMDMAYVAFTKERARGL